MEFLKNGLSPEVVWILLGLVLFFFELALPGLVIFFFALGAFLTALVVSLFGVGVNSQLAVFLCSSLLMLGVLRRYLKNIFGGILDVRKKANVNNMEFIGERASVVKAIIPPQKGKIEFHGSAWDASSEEKIEAGCVVEITGRENITYKVRKIS